MNIVKFGFDRNKVDDPGPLSRHFYDFLFF